jgi:hypothetical protein
MPDDAPLPLAPPPAPSSPSDDQAIRIEQLLTAGLDEYFAGRYDGAVQVWSRVFFLDRTNARARAYIERARSAVAERQRVAEATAAALADPQRGWSESRAHETRPMTEAGVFVVSGALVARLAPPQPVEAAPAPYPDPAVSAASRRSGIAHALLVAAAGVLLFVAGYTVAARDRLAEFVTGVSSPRGPAAKAGSAEVALHDAEQAFDARRYDDARRALARIPAGDPLRPAADALVARIQRAWPIVSPMLAPGAPVGGTGSP